MTECKCYTVQLDSETEYAATMTGCDARPWKVTEDCSIHRKQPQAASGGALSAEQVWKDYRHARWPDRNEEWSQHWKDVAVDFAAYALAAHDQKVRDEAKLEGQLEIARKWHSLTKHRAGTYECCRLVTALEREQAALAL